ncbi:hypothetical protein [Magnetospirillum aberrantis]|uniref:Outer membrane protein assembly factor BamE n=1 Tax=Magnetospirillum aberrantis SpK TaxID=908842 RepID=A0A7C9UYW1_9PROT|nr:hypothetical protein [Magnetospirillum aberrantis]NFV79874.1 hypothetical protein [Magnetospirillum aberrantis SpK]
MRRLFFACVAVVMVAACTSTTGTSISEERLAELKKGRATIQDVTAQFGQPSAAQLMPNGERVLVYTQQKVRMDPKAAIPIVGLFANESGYSTATVSITFATDGTLASYSSQSMNFGGGTSYSSGAK